MEMFQANLMRRQVSDKVRLSWRDVLFGLENQLLDLSVPAELAGEQLAEYDYPSASLIELAGTRKGEPIIDLVRDLAESEPPCRDAEIRSKWVYLVLDGLYQHREEFSDPLEMVEAIYADFDYPEEIRGLVRYMPREGPDRGSREAGEQRVYEKWKKYLDTAGHSFECH